MDSGNTVATAMPAFVAGSDTSKAAAESMREAASSIRAHVLAHIVIVQRATGGVTCDEVEESLGLRHQTASARIRELAMQKRIVDSGARRETRSGRLATVWRAA